MEYRTQIVSLAVVLTILFNFFRNKRMPFLSTKLFTTYISLVATNIVFELFSLYTLLHMEQVSPWLNRFSHQLYIGTLDLTIFFLYLYVDVKEREQKRYEWKELLLRMLPLLVALMMVFVGGLEYYVGEDGAYSYGPMAITVYLSIAIYLCWIVKRLFLRKRCFVPHERSTILIGITVWAIIAIAQFFNPTLLLSSMAITLMALFVYISMENPREYMDCDMESVFSQKAYNLVVTEALESKQKFWIVNVALMNERLVRTTYGNSELSHILEHIAKAMSRYTKKDAYHSHRQMVAVILKDKKACEQLLLDGLVEEIQRELLVDHEMVDLRLTVLECPTYATTYLDVENVMDFVNGKHFEANDRIQFVVNQDMVDKYQYYATVEQLVQKAIKEDGLEVFYQPIYSTQKKKFVSAEALVRLKDKETVGFVSPELFIPIAERRGYINELGQIIFEKVCKFYKENNLQNMGIEYIEVNLSGKQIVDKHLPEQLLACMKQYELSPTCINLEITETAAVNAEDILTQNMECLQGAGFGFSMDDFGTGYSNLSKMADVGFDLIKLDKSLIWPCFEENSEGARVILNSCVDMIHRLGRHIVAEGVETEEQVDMLTDKGVSYLQGYYFSRPLPEAQYLEFMEQATQ